MARICDFCSTSSAAVHCKADVAHLCLSCDSELHSANQVVNRHPRTILCDSCNHLSAYDGCLDHGGGGLMCHLCDRSHLVTTSPVHQRLSSSSYSYTGCPAAEDFAAIWGLQMNHDHISSASHVGSLDILGQILDLQRTQSTVPLGLCSNKTSQSDKMQDQLRVSDDDPHIPDDEYLAFLNLEELIGDEDDQDLIVKTQQLLDDPNLDTAAASKDGRTESSSLPANGSSCSLPSSVSCNTFSSSSMVSQGVKGEQVFDARANAMMRYKQKKHSRVYERKIRYQRKKAIADSRKRVRGRFARN
ncbi:PREDICTED: zinc finger protein CONSTANS-LIKE 15-like isoform X2 [Fragaria vesca subsp. vesca]|uniref:zinc finger protein CONSTANS-LIKE 15-like isoform X2 n=1 Tax=Fragaria vesca subsp. vesca TaxID=101020 RepID=UPI0002C32F9D|nr:PREDICTED: zinc finger protein CONSTANS-LIKE 15-like isoform X2 [Fragaria vesca subsp. vesca]